MRKAISRKGSRRKQSSDGTSKNSNNHLSPSNSSQSDQNGDQAQRRKVSEGEAVLTAKNYRLAKELSELRVRHREESKNVTRLTMENMNLASRCREAISHVAMLKKELAMHQRRSAEALALQRQQQVEKTRVEESGSSELVPSVEQMTAEMEQMERIMANHSTPKPSEDDGASPTARSLGSNGSPTSEFYSDYEEEKQTVNRDEDACNDIGYQRMKDCFVSKSTFSAPVSTLSKSKNYNEGFPDDLPLSSKKRLSKLSRRTPPGILETESETSSSATLESNTSKDKHKSIMSSIDAFEASFETSFPVSFDSRHDNQSTTSEIYNPFCPSPAREKLKSGGTETSSDASLNENCVRDQVSSLTDSKEAKHSSTASDEVSTQDSKRKNASSNGKDDKSLTRQFREPSPSMLSSIPDRPVRDESPRAYDEPVYDVTPPPVQRIRGAKNLQEPDEPQTPNSDSIVKNESNLEQPQRPEKTMSQAARARYEKALQPRDSAPKRFHGSRMNQNTEQDESSKSEEAKTKSFRDVQGKRKQSNAEGTKSISYDSRAPNVNLRRQHQENNEKKSENIQASNHLSNIRNTYSKSKASSLSKFFESNDEARPGTSNGFQDKDSPKSTGNVSSSPSVSSAISAYENAVRKHREEDASSKIPKTTYRPRSLRSLSPVSQGPESDKEDKNQATITPADDWLDRRRFRSDSYDANNAKSRIEYLKEQNYITQQKIEEEYNTDGKNVPYLNSVSSGRSVRRSIKQPISYAEPNINSKLRRGDVFFAKGDNDEVHNSSEMRKDYVTSPLRL
eukprot:CAMPEP_0178928152 /NCGR_PEP_ID=MMETSP0786-20121207/19695_1 /TAXON_ID=186022 /ORGANISM="Thalassionema frauenfeldii, Strain CCMP 1798" /LENGTH=792 /DNA_ID=CAMNT_0020603885 /DNA_START=17 /DNA_END=2395 /DNA_ORIENTATION=-